MPWALTRCWHSVLPSALSAPHLWGSAAALLEAGAVEVVGAMDDDATAGDAAGVVVVDAVTSDMSLTSADSRSISAFGTSTTTLSSFVAFFLADVAALVDLVDLVDLVALVDVVDVADWVVAGVACWPSSCLPCCAQ